jgi:hypothetical protein
VKRFALATLAIVAALIAAMTLLLPPLALPAAPADFGRAWPVARGAFHVHSQRSDGTGTIDEIAAAAARVGLHFVILTDHSDGTRAPEPPSYRSGVLMIDGVEISTQYGHYAAIDLPQSPYPLAGHPRDVIEDVRRLGGFGFAAHPGSPKAGLRWDDWDAPYDGIEWLNADSEWRDELWGSLGRALLTYAVRPVETLGRLLDRPEPVLRQWARATHRRRIAAIAGADAHARLSVRQATDPYDDRVIARIPSYDVSLAAFTNHVILNGTFTTDAANDAALVTSGIREGRMFTSIDALARLSAFEAKATSGAVMARPGEYLAFDGPAVIEAHVGAPEGTSLIVLRDGVPVYEVVRNALRIDVGQQPGAYRIEARLPSRLAPPSVPWVLSNPMYVGLREVHVRAAIDPPAPPVTERSAIATAAWRAEASEGSTSVLRPGTLDDGTPAAEWQFALAAGARGAQYAAVRFPIDSALSAFDRLQLRARSDQPRRIWAQLRVPEPRGGERWGKTFFVHDGLSSIELRFADFRPIGSTATERPPLDRIDSLLLVVDTLNTSPGASGRIWIPDLWLAR